MMNNYTLYMYLLFSLIYEHDWFLDKIPITITKTMNKPLLFAIHHYCFHRTITINAISVILINNRFTKTRKYQNRLPQYLLSKALP